MSKKNQHVVPHNKGWAVKTEGNPKPTSIHEKQSNAISQARTNALRNHSELLVHNREGQIRERNSYGHDPYPPKG
jgi:hypothetical protein